MKKILFIFLLLPFVGISQNYVIKYIDTTLQTYVINDTLKGELIKIRHLYAFDSVLLKKEISKYNESIKNSQNNLIEITAIEQKKIDKLKATRKRLTRILTKLRE